MSATDVIMGAALAFAERFEETALQAAADGIPGAQEHLEACRRVDHVLGDIYYLARAIEHYAHEDRRERGMSLNEWLSLCPDGFPP